MLKRILVGLVIGNLFLGSVNAASVCGYDEQNTLKEQAANIRPSYEMVTTLKEEKPQYNIYDRYAKITLLNITNKFYVVIKNNINSEEKTFKYADTSDGTLTYNWNNIKEVTNFTIEVYSSENTGCPNELYKTLYITTPRYNSYHTTAICEDMEDLDLCQEYVTFNEMSQDTFIKEVSAKRPEEKEESQNIEVTPGFFDKLLKFANRYKWFITGAGTIIIVGVLAYSINARKKDEENKNKNRNRGKKK